MITTNNQPRPIVYGYDLTPEDRKEYTKTVLLREIKYWNESVLDLEDQGLYLMAEEATEHYTKACVNYDRYLMEQGETL